MAEEADEAALMALIVAMQAADKMSEALYSNEAPGVSGEDEETNLHAFAYDWTHNKENSKVAERVTPEFLNKVVEISGRLGVAPDDLMAIMAFESWLNPASDNGKGYVGLIQFGSVEAGEIGTTQQALVAMSTVEQMEYVEKYYIMKAKYAGTQIKTLSDLYMATLWPSAVGKPEDYVLWIKDSEATGGRYKANAGLDIGKDGKITKGEAVRKVTDRRDSFDKR